MKKIGYCCCICSVTLIGIIFIWSFLLTEKGTEVQTIAKVKKINEVRVENSLMSEQEQSDEPADEQKASPYEETYRPEPTAANTTAAAKTDLEKKSNGKKNTKKEKKKKPPKSNKSKETKHHRSNKKNQKKKIIRGKRIDAYYSVRVIDSNKRIKIDRSEVNVLERIVQAEAGGQDEKGRILVANVILNRLRKKTYPKSIKGVVFAYSHGYYQFSPVMDGRYYSVNVSNGTKKAVKKALEGKDFSKGALYFMNRRMASSKNAHWFDTHLDFVLKHGGHEFFK
ncbi:MAG: cell wall hydrolase [Lachnoclostridium sp.]|nr:cell wall hydrolase [Lachnoclostridium sp.]